jgi:hypothetical protein
VAVEAQIAAHNALSQLASAEERLARALVVHNFRELVLAREQRRLDYARWNLPAPPDPEWYRKLMGE